ncbi:hypothetical protein PSTG_04720 [Puccinia striiformis f. sp. tritici PST-78]|uniref:Uncharacterized protein n=1 Tax=Puccinia striiformis f. sp. tritici PST-78 TaxID=1165861 RepID=A0A0L0VSH8_9BASI|nr:hypothetical protein PSTG_04720 [Puccinia striiformis f. sp. tritici PST-78]
MTTLIKRMLRIKSNLNQENEDDKDEEIINHGSKLVSDLIHDEEIELETDNVEELSDEEDEDRYTSISCKATLAKFRCIARKLNKSPNSKALFAKICREENCLKPHTVERDMRTQWNSMHVQLCSIKRCAKAIKISATEPYEHTTLTSPILT